MTAAAGFVITSFDGRCVILLPSRLLSLCGEPLSLVHYTGGPNLDCWAETLSELTIAALACDQRRCRHTLASVEVIPPVAALCLRSELPPRALPASVAARVCGGAEAAATAISAAIPVL